MKQENRIQQFGKNGDVIAIQCLSIKGLFSAQLRTDSFDADTTFMTVRNNEIVSSFTAKVICALGVLLTSFCTFADTWTDPYTGHMWDYYINGLGYAEIISVSPPTGAVTIPAMLGGKPVVSVGFWDNCKGVTSVTIPDGVRNIWDGAFKDWSGLTSVSIPDSVTSIGASAFDGCSGLTSVTIPEGVTSIEEFTFNNCSSLTNVTIPSSVKSIGERAFRECGGLTSVTIPNGVTSIGEAAFAGCSGLTSMTIPNGVTSIGTSVFDGCSGLTNVTIPNSVTSIGRWAFYDCRGLKSVTIPSSVTSIQDNAFSYCSGLMAFSVSMDNLVYKSVDGFLLSKDGRTLILGVNGEVVIPDSVKIIGDDAFYGYDGLTGVTIPDSVTSIGSAAFYDCSSLTNVKIPNSVMRIGDHAFCHCSSLTSLVIPDGVTSIGKECFWFSGLTSVMIPDSVTSIGSMAFSFCDGLTSVYIPETFVLPNNVFPSGAVVMRYARINIGNGVWLVTNCDEPIILDVPLVKPSGNLIIPAEIKGRPVVGIAASAFSGCSGLVSITIPDGVTSIGVSSFEECSGLDVVYVPMSVSRIGVGAFADGVKSVVFCGAPPDVVDTDGNVVNADSYVGGGVFGPYGLILSDAHVVYQPDFVEQWGARRLCGVAFMQDVYLM